MTLRVPALGAIVAFVLTTLFVLNPTPSLMALFTFVAQPLFLFSAVFYLRRVFRVGSAQHALVQVHDGAADLGVETGKAQATFLVLDRTFALQDDGIDVGPFLIAAVAVAGKVEDDQSVGQGDLRRGQSKPLGFVHRIQHLLGRLANLGINGRQRLAGVPQRRMWVLNDLHTNIHRRTESPKTPL